ncbi:hypothetical protein GCE86_08690 [Micromonospora terminaliae]|uniref:Nucleotide exchange factor GrpE n=1 Tax=Micromonospora terminaliae TaxID=1914461 RepID=A0AAJ2ZEP4_9ACTN|nr:hypothetical protein [Micromonospora terminaliae]NES28136.1 hypothetical protein [Micromonospora terminaliae]QGL47119.1 hypothetical protein GCE86_08690 [Micromonospora terminaliae]
MRWEDNGEEELIVAAGSIKRAQRDSLRHQALIDPAPIVGWFADDPMATIVRLLREHRSKMTGLRIRQELEQLGLDPAAVRKAWASASKTLGNNPQVEVTGKKGAPLFRWIGARDSSAEAAAPSAPGAETLPESSPGPNRRHTTASAAAQTTETVRADGGVQPEPTAPAPEQRVSQESAPAATERAPHVAAGTKAEPGASSTQPTLAERIAAVVGEEHPAELRDYLSRPLAIGARFGQVDGQRIDDFLGSLAEHDREVALSLLLALPRQSAAVGGGRQRKLVDGGVVEPVLAAAAAELRGYAAAEPAVLTAAAWLLRRASGVEDLPGSAAASLISLMVKVASARREQDVTVLDAAVGTLSRLLPALSRDERTGLDLTGLAQAVAHLPLSRDGGRAALLAAIGKFRSKALLAPDWWESVTLDALAECATGPLGGVTSRPEIVEQYVRPLVARELSRVTSRTRLGFLLGLPGEFVSNLPADALAAAFRRVAGDDEVVAALVGALAQERRIDALRQDVERARTEAAAAGERVEEAERRAAVLADRCDRLEESLRAEHRQASSLRSAQDRQIQIDVIRSLADLAAEVEELAAEQTTPDVLVERVRALAYAQALEPVGQAGQKLPFDPTAHEPIVGAPSNHDAVTVIRPGYRWRPSGEDILIEKALVTTT